MPPPRSPFARVAVVGCGLVGGSVARAAAGLDGVTEVVIVDHDPDVLARAQALGVGDRWTRDPGDGVAGADLVVLATPVAVTGAIYQQVRRHLAPGAVVTDVGSVKANVLVEVEGSLGSTSQGAVTAPAGAGSTDSRFIGGHPMAGSEHSGVEASDGSLFQGVTWILTPTRRSDPAAFEALSTFLRALGARVLAVEPELHDRLVAIASHLPQVLASTLMDEAADAAERTGAAVLTVAAGGFRDATRVAGSDPDLWVGILRENRAAVLDAVDGFLERLQRVRAAVEAGEWDDVRGLLERARRARTQLPAKERAGRLVDLVVPVADRPGVLAEVTTALGESGVNIEDLAMRHATEGERGALLVAVDADTADAALEVLVARGLPAHLEAR